MLASVRVLWPSLGIVHPCLTALNVSDPLCANLKGGSSLFTFFYPGLLDHQLFVNLLECSSLLGAVGTL